MSRPTRHDQVLGQADASSAISAPEWPSGRRRHFEKLPSARQLRHELAARSVVLPFDLLVAVRSQAYRFGLRRRWFRIVGTIGYPGVPGDD
jgi:hypothetical protein